MKKIGIILFALAVIPMWSVITRAITVNPASSVLGDSDNTPLTVIYRDGNGNFKAGSSTFTNVAITGLTVSQCVQTDGSGNLASSGSACGGGGGSPTGSAGGDLGSTYPNPTVVSVSNVTSPTFPGPNFSVGVSTLSTASGSVMIDTATVFAGSTALTVSNHGSSTLNFVLTAPTGVNATEKIIRGSNDAGASALQFSDYPGSNVWQIGMDAGVNPLSIDYNGTTYFKFLTTKPSLQIGATATPFNGEPLDILVSAAAGAMASFVNTHAGTSIVYFDVPDGSQAEYRFTTSGGTAKWGMANNASDNWILTNDNTSNNDITASTANDSITLAGGFVPKSKTKAQFDALVPDVIGEVFTCSNCTRAYDLCVSTGTLAAQWRTSGNTNGCGTNN